MIRSEDQGEIIHHVREDVTDKHGLSISDEDVRKEM